MRLRVLFLGLPLLAVAAVPALRADEPKPVPPKAAYTKDVAPLLNKYCIGCHSTEKKRAGVVLDRFKDDEAAVRDHRFWERVLPQVRSGEMPPKGKPQPTAAERNVIAGWIDGTVLAVNCTGPRDPGRMTIRRLNRAEYNNTIRDLVGLNLNLADDFPSDDVGYGFDNIGDVLSMPPILMEKYLAAAGQVAAKAIVTPEDAARAAARKHNARDLKATAATSPNPRGPGVVLAVKGELGTRTRFSTTGEYTLRVRAAGGPAGNEAPRMTVRLDDRELKTFDVKALPPSPEVYELKTTVQAGEHSLAVAFINEFQDPKATDPRRRERRLLIEFIEVLPPVDGLPKDLPESHRRVVIASPKDRADREPCARKIITSFASRAWRRSATEDEVLRLLRLFKLAEDSGDSFEKGVRLMVQAVLVSPHFLFRIESGPRSTDTKPVEPIGQYELASRLSYFLWSSMPDDELLELAKKEELRKPEVLEAQVRRMLKDPKLRGLVENFAGQWLQTRGLKTYSPDLKTFPDWDGVLRDAMLKETDLFFEAVVREDRSVLDFLDADFTFVNERLARHYGIENVKGSDFRRVSLAGPAHGGLLTQASILTVTSNPNRTSPVKRGKWILETILNTPPPPPPPDVPELATDRKAALVGSLRQRMEKHRENPTCASCHSRMDPLGFGFENFDAIGAFRKKDGTFDIDPSGTLPDGKTFKGPAELKVILKGQKELFAKCLAEKMLTYALGRGLEAYDRCAVDDVATALAKRDYRFSGLVLAVVKSDPFLMRRGKR